MKEKELIHQICNGNPQAFRFLVKQYERLVFHVAARLLNRQEDLEDVCQEVFIKVHQKLPEFRGDSKLSTWIATIAYRVAVNHIKKKKAETDIDDSEREFLHNDMITYDHPQNIIEKQELKAYVRQMVDRLPSQYKTVLSLYHLEEMGYKEIVEITGLPEGTVKNYIFRARKLLKELIKNSELVAL
ncbi:RNA polymerase sigma factor [Ancylomarina euxinus]|uniref:RNA polymerase sigma factor n=1 Tax=Ancylomarina euxinus TaxID=2283627 RepID=A0A425Y5R7_9BACT|nr:RNA polymerase sigma factor [Ancylomarina euxinus]MCZ4694285.1 RNA polymerase sigma factor [Ancylomarina euxinus]MUP14384.1 sigma-70 family RNA polymerase sigma factor [Ancylomarina euxinus]RRG23694.1 RNA polymerase sigma factor [Ancylomarina euxinus]